MVLDCILFHPAKRSDTGQDFQEKTPSGEEFSAPGMAAQRLALPAADFDKLNPPGGSRLAHETDKIQSHEQS
jgi:hypothetical protein